jgi:hypothetical protein
MALIIPGAPDVIVVPVVGIQGPPGVAGGFEYLRAVAATTWIIDHNLGRKVHVSIFSDASEVVYADVTHGSINQTSITFAAPTTGSAVIS